MNGSFCPDCGASVTRGATLDGDPISVTRAVGGALTIAAWNVNGAGTMFADFDPAEDDGAQRFTLHRHDVAA